jgi:hypothetical protein
LGEASPVRQKISAALDTYAVVGSFKELLQRGTASKTTDGLMQAQNGLELILNTVSRIPALRM